MDIVVDLDIINPYFRSREMDKELSKYDIESISSDISERASLDMPYISSRIFKPFHNKTLKAIYDLGGNDQGAKLLRQFDDYHHVDIDLFLVVNIYRQETDSVDKIRRLIHKIEGMGGFKITGLINNSNLLRDTTKEEIAAGQQIVKAVSELSNLPIVYTTIWNQVDTGDLEILGERIDMNLYLRKSWL